MIPFPPYSQIHDLIALARSEDLGHAADDVTSRLLIPESAQGRGLLVQKQPGVVCGLPIILMVCRLYDDRLTVWPLPGESLESLEGSWSDEKRQPLAIVSGPLRSLLSAERVILNFIQRLSGVATKTRRFVDAIQGTSARIYDTRKTTPGYRLLEKYAVRCGGGANHRMGLYDGLLVKDNHIAAIALPELTDQLRKIVAVSRAEAPGRFIQIEVDTLDQLREVLRVDRVDSILLDNMDCPTLRQAVALRNAATALNLRPTLEASGGVNLATVRAIAEAGVDRISVGALTHSAVALDIGLDVE
jgi:nicotinate-nucleotide pyrophosphorylase (carboxylating)